MQQFKGVYAASLTPLNADLTCDYDAYADKFNKEFQKLGVY